MKTPQNIPGNIGTGSNKHNMSTNEFLKGIFPEISDNGQIMEKYLILLGLEKLKETVVDFTSTHNSFTHGQEGEIFKLDIDNKGVVIIKRRSDLGGENEYEIHGKGYDLSEGGRFGVRVPKPIAFFTKGDYDYILMEYINGKTLYNLIWSGILDQVLLPEFEIYLLNQNDQLIKNSYNELKKMYLNSGKIDFQDDTICEEGIRDLLTIMFDAGYLKENPLSVSFSENKPGIKEYPNLEKIYKSNFSKINIFGSQKKQIISYLKEFIRHLNKNGLYHRDLGGNPRNIMFSIENGNFIPYIIDFGKSIILPSGEKYDYEDTISGGRFDNDMGVVEAIDSMNGKDQSEKKYFDKNKYNSISKNFGFNLDEVFYNQFLNRATDLSIFDKIQKYFLYLLDIKNKNGGNFIDLNSQEDYEKNTRLKNTKVLVMAILIMNDEEFKKLKDFIDENLKNKKSSREYKYAFFIKSIYEQLSDFRD